MTSGMRAAACSLALALCCTGGWACTGGVREQDTAMGSTGADPSATTGTTGELPPAACGPDSHSSYDELGQCWCDLGHTWNSPFDPNDFGCHPIEPRAINCDQTCDPSTEVVMECDGAKQSCDCPEGDRWCSEDTTDTRCCSDPAQHKDPLRPDTEGEPESSGSSGASSSGASSSDTSSGGTTASGTSEQ